MTRAMDRLFSPRSIAIVGASHDPLKRGHQILRALGESGFAGPVYPVNPRGGLLLQRPVIPSVAELPKGVDLAVLCTPAGTAPDLVRECGKRGVGGAVVLAVGFGESGAGGGKLQDRLRRAARESGVRVVGPNTSGLLNLHAGVNVIGAAGVRAGGIALLVQSGNIALALMKEVTERTCHGISICAGLGNQADVGFGEVLEYLGDHEQTRAVVVYAEGFGDAGDFFGRLRSRVARSRWSSSSRAELRRAHRRCDLTRARSRVRTTGFARD